ncbi:MAG: oligosaccharide flippase family protein [Bacteroidia bacterium]|nr:oligosaccharide flippase family protein [Bacteroidia bacterium]
MKKIVHEDNFLSLVGNLTISFFGIAGFALLARSFQMEVFGEWVLFISSAAFIEMFRYGIINTAIIRFLSGAEQEERVKFIGSNGLIGLIATFIICILLYVCLYTFYESIHNSGYELFFKWYPLLALINLPMNTALVIMQADLKFGKILFIRSLESVGFFVVVVVNFFFLQMTLLQLVLAFLVIDAFTSGVCIFMGWDGLKYIPKATKNAIKVLLNFSKYTTFTLIGTNLLRSADTFIISFSPLGTAAVALYSIPMKLTELQQIPLRSFAATAFPKLSKASMQKNVEEVKEIFYTYSGAMTYLFIFISLVTFVFADFFILILGGRQYLGTDPITGFNAATIMRIFSIYGLLLPIDRMTGIGLDSINKPNINFLKVLYMVIANVIGDLIAVFIFKSLSLVAVASIFFTTIGIWVGFYYMNKELSLNYRHIFTSGIDFYKMLYGKFMKNLT